MRSLQSRLIVGLGLGLFLLWLLGAGAAVQLMNGQMQRAADATLASSAQRLLPLIARQQAGRMSDRRVRPLRAHQERFAYIVRDAQGQIVLRSHNFESDAHLPPVGARGFFDRKDQRLFQEVNPRGGMTITLAEPRAQRLRAMRQIYMALVWPMLAVIPLTMLVVWAVLRHSLRPLRALGGQIAARDSWDLSPLRVEDMPTELEPITTAVNGLMARLQGAFAAERAFAANAAHELRTPIAAAQAHVQRLEAELQDPSAQQRAAELAEALRRLTRLSEKLMQLARAEGGRLRGEEAHDLVPVLHMVLDDLKRRYECNWQLDLPDAPVMSRVDRDIFGILIANLIENAARYGTKGAPIEITLRADQIAVRNSGTVLAPEALQRLTHRFERASEGGEGAGLGLSIVAAIAQGLGAQLRLSSPIPGRDEGFEAHILGL